MKKNKNEPEFIVDHTGKPTKVVLSINVYEKMLEELEDRKLGKIATKLLKEKNQFTDFAKIKKRILKY